MRTRDEHWWRKHRLADPESWRRGASQKFYAVLELDGAVAGYAVYRVKDEWEDGLRKGGGARDGGLRDLARGRTRSVAVPGRDRP